MTDAPKTNLGIFDLTSPVTLTYRSLDKSRAFKDKSGKDKGEAKFDGTFLFEPKSADLEALKEKAASIARARWPNVSFKDLVFPFASGDKRLEKWKAKNPGKEVPEINQAEAGKVVLTARSKFRPNLAAIINGQLVDLETDEQVAKYISQFYSGVQVFATFNLVTYEGVRDGDKNGVTAYLNAVATLNKGDKIKGGGGGGAAERFSQYAGTASDFDPTAVDLPGSDDDNIPY